MASELIRFRGPVEQLGPAGDLGAMTDWIGAIPFERWPQQTRLADGQIRPAMVNDPEWHGFQELSAPVMGRALQIAGARIANDPGVLPPGWPGSFVASNPMLSVVMPGSSIEPHRDRQPDAWVIRVHVPLVTNNDAWFVTWDEGERPGRGGGKRFNLKAGTAYMVNAELVHAVWNGGDTPRIHFMFDVMAQQG